MKLMNTSSVNLVALMLTLIPSIPAAAETTWFPLVVGQRWIYENERGGPATRKITVVEEQPPGFLVEFDGNEAVIAPGYDILLEGEGAVPYYRFGSDSWLHRDFRSCDDLRIMTVTARDETVDTPAGTFTDCIHIVYEPGQCADAGTFEEWWAPEVGKVKWTEGGFAGPKTWVLNKTFNGGPVIKFRRGDADGDTTVSLTDAIGILTYLYLDGDAPACADAADANDDGLIDLSDAIADLFYLFSAGDAPPEPGPDFCGEDPTEDSLPACDPGSCMPRNFSGGH
jgi:hypothetical protein